MSELALIDPVQDSRWDKFVESHPFGWICHLSGWKQVLQTSFPRMKGHYLALFDDTHTNIKAGMPVFDVRSWLTSKRLVSIPFATISDPLISDRDELSTLLESVKDLAKRIGASHIEIRARASSELIEGSAELAKVDRFKQHFLPMEGDSESLRKSFHRTCVRKNIRKAERKNLKVRITEEGKDIETFYTLYSSTRKFNGLPAQPLLFIQSIFREFIPDGRVVLLMAELDSKPIAAMVLYKFKNRVSAEFLGWDRSFIEDQPSVFIYWEAIKMAQKEGYKIFDFGRTAVSNQSLMDFKGHWGTKVTGLPHFYYPIEAAQSILAKDGFLGMDLVSKVFSGIPNILYQRVGNYCYRHMS
jgi:serine/alanine adding enzyme